jgi:hypothetical protein
MRISMLIGTGVLVMCVVVGCGGSSAEEAIFKDQIKLYNDGAAVYDKVTDKASFEKANAEAMTITKKALEIAAKQMAEGMKSPERMASAAKKYEGQLKEAQEKFSKAQKAALEKAMK